MGEKTSAVLQIPTWGDVTRLIQQIGVVGVLASALLWFVLRIMDDRLATLETNQRVAIASVNSLAASENRTLELMAQHDMTAQMILYVLQVTCVNEAPDNQARERCLSRPVHGDKR